MLLKGSDIYEQLHPTLIQLRIMSILVYGVHGVAIVDSWPKAGLPIRSHRRGEGEYLLSLART